jgi:predicted nucleic acid-binding protein
VKLADANAVLDFCGVSPERMQRARSVVAIVEESGEPLVITEVVLAEVFWVLASGYSVRGEEAVEIVESLLSAVEFTVWDEALVSCAFDVKRRVPALDIADCILAARALVHDDEIVTNDRALIRVIQTETQR